MQDDNDPAQGLWTPHTVEETQKIYSDWADHYESDVGAWGYATPHRIALALRKAGASVSKPVLDFGCGTGLSGRALKAVGFDIVDGTDVSPQMLAKAEQKDVYRQVWIGTPGSLGHVGRGDYATISACGVISLGAAPPETLDMLVGALGPAGMLAFSYNDATLENTAYMNKLASVVAIDGVEIIFEDYGPHLPEKNMNSKVYIVQKT